MTNHPIKDKIISELESLSEEQQKKLLDYTLKLKLSMRESRTGSKLIKFSGSISKADLNVMKKAIDEDCEQVDLNEW